MQSLLSLLPNDYVLFFSFLLAVAHSENQRWIAKCSTGLAGKHKEVGAFSDHTGFLAMLFGYVFLAAYFYDHGPMKTAVFFGFLFITVLVANIVLSLLYRGENAKIWLVWTWLMWLPMLALLPQVSWFGWCRKWCN